MKKIFFLLAFVLGCVSSYAQVITVYENGTLVNTYTNGGDKSYKVVVSKDNYYPGDGKEHEMVDLGLSVKWATCNIGAETAYDDGDYLAWGETSSKYYYYQWNTYKHGTSTDNRTKYNSTDSKTVLDPEDDAATVNWGTGYRIPTKDEWAELAQKCTWTWDSEHKGYFVKGTNGNSIFLPASGYRHDNDLSDYNGNGNYWSSTLNDSNRNNAFYIYFSSGNRPQSNDYYRYCGFSVRPVAE